MKCQKCGKPTRINWGSGELVLCKTHQDCEGEFDHQVLELRQKRVAEYDRQTYKASNTTKSALTSGFIHQGMVTAFSQAAGFLIAIPLLLLGVFSGITWILYAGLFLALNGLSSDARALIVCSRMFKSSLYTLIAGLFICLSLGFFSPEGAAYTLSAVIFLVWYSVAVANIEELYEVLHGDGS